MDWREISIAGCGTLATLVGVLLLLAQPSRAADTAQEFPCVVQIEAGDIEFAPGDNITIEEVRGTSDTIKVGETYCVSGSYTLSSEDLADLSFFATTTNTNGTPIDSKQTMRIGKGSGSFRLIKNMDEDGYLHLTFYSRASGKGIGGIYFGQGQWVLHNKQFAYLTKAASSGDTAPAGKLVSTPGELSFEGANRTLFGYLGNPVEPPPGIDAAYTKEGLINAMQTAAQNAGVTITRIDIDDSEFPPIIGMICPRSERAKLREPINNMKDYKYWGGTGTPAYEAFNIVPHRAFPRQVNESLIDRRLNMRCIVLCNKEGENLSISRGASPSAPLVSAPIGSVPDARNRALFEYLGNPVSPPQYLDPAYSKEGMMNAMQTAAQNAGVTLTKLEIDDSEFPFLVGVVCPPGGLDKLKEQITNMNAYKYSGSVSSDTCAAFNITPYVNQQVNIDWVYRRLVLREAGLRDRINNGGD